MPCLTCQDAQHIFAFQEELAPASRQMPTSLRGVLSHDERLHGARSEGHRERGGGEGLRQVGVVLSGHGHCLPRRRHIIRGGTASQRQKEKKTHLGPTNGTLRKNTAIHHEGIGSREGEESHQNYTREGSKRCQRTKVGSSQAEGLAKSVNPPPSHTLARTPFPLLLPSSLSGLTSHVRICSAAGLDLCWPKVKVRGRVGRLYQPRRI